MGEAKRRGTYEERLSMAKKVKKTTSETVDFQDNTKTPLKKPVGRTLSSKRLAAISAILVGLE